MEELVQQLNGLNIESETAMEIARMYITQQYVICAVFAVILGPLMWAIARILFGFSRDDQ